MKILTLIFGLLPATLLAQLIPSKISNVDFLQTFGKAAPDSWGDDDNNQTYFVGIPKASKQPFYIRVFDPETGGQHDQKNAAFDTKCTYTVYGGKGCYSNPDAVKINPTGQYDSGLKLATKTFGTDDKYDNGWYTFGPFNPAEGEYAENLKLNVFKIICNGISGNDGNAYRYFISSKADENAAVEGSNSFAYEIAFRLKKEVKSTAHFYPFVDGKVVSVHQHNFDFDGDGYIRITSFKRKSHPMKGSGDGEWQTSSHDIMEGERNSSLDVHLIKETGGSNDMVLYLENQYKQAIPFFSVPINGIPNYEYNVSVTRKY